MCAKSPYHMAEWVMGALPPIISLRVAQASVVSGRVNRVRGFKLAVDGKLILVPGKPAGELGRIVTVDRIGETVWRVFERGGQVFATQVHEPDESGRRDWFHFLDSLNQDVTPYVHAAVARLAARLAGIRVPEPPVNPKAGCLTCKAFRRFAGPDQVTGDSIGGALFTHVRDEQGKLVEAPVPDADPRLIGRIPSLSTIRRRDEGPWQAEVYWCSARQEVPPDVARLVQEHNALARRGYPDPVLPLDRAGENCRLWLPKAAGSRGSIASWEVPAGFAETPVDEPRDGARVVRVRGAQWEIQLPLVAPNSRLPEPPKPVSKPEPVKIDFGPVRRTIWWTEPLELVEYRYSGPSPAPGHRYPPNQVDPAGAFRFRYDLAVSVLDARRVYGKPDVYLLEKQGYRWCALYEGRPVAIRWFGRGQEVVEVEVRDLSQVLYRGLVEAPGTRKVG